MKEVNNKHKHINVSHMQQTLFFSTIDTNF